MCAGERSSDAVEEAERTRSGTSPRLRIVTCEAGDTRRAEAEQFIRDRFRRTHGAHIETFMPTLLMATAIDGTLQGVAGCRAADGNALFLERYLDAPIEEVLSKSTGARVRRSEVVEVGNFACRDSRVACAFTSQLPRYLIGMGNVWIAFTATVSIRRILRLLGARCVNLGAADGACARDGADRWGRYYSNDPRVMGGYLPLARRIPALWGASYAD
jgi:hypothetical protein